MADEDADLEQVDLQDRQDPGADLDQEETEATPQASPIVTTPRAARRVVEPAPIAAGAQPVYADFGAGTPASGQHGALRSFGDQVWANTLQMGQGLLGAASLAARKLTEDPATVSWIEQQKRALGDHIAATVETMSPKAQLAMHASLFGSGEDVPTPGEVGWGNYIGATVASVIPQAVLAVVPQKVLGPVVGTLVSAGGFGAIQAGDAYNSLVDAVDKASPKDLMGSPVYAHLVQSGISDTDARKTLVGQIAPSLAAAQFAVGAAAGAGIGGLLTRGPLGAAGASLLKRAGIGAAEGAGTMGAQSAIGDVLQQQANTAAGVQKGYDPVQTARALASGALGGALLGTAGGALHGKSAPEIAEPAIETSPHVPSDQQAAISEVLTPGADAAAVEPFPQRQMLTFNPDRTQGEGFTTAPNETAPEPAGDIKAQVAQLLNPDSTRDAVYVAKGTPMPRGLPPEVTRVLRPEGTLLTTNTAKAALFRKAPQLDDTIMAHLLGFPETKAQASATGAPAVVQAKDAAGQVTAEMAASPQGEPAARAVAAAQAPGSTIETVPPEMAIARRLAEPIEAPHPVEQAAARAEEPTPAQAEAGNYQKGHVSIQGLDISIEIPKGGVRKGPLDAEGKPAWQATMPAHYGYIRGTKGGDGEQVDVQLGPRTKALFDGTPAQAANEPVYVVDQIDPKTGRFDEHKALLGFHTELEATRAYDTAFTDGSGPSRRGAVTEMPFDQFKDWVTSGDTAKPVAYKPGPRSELLKRRELERRRMAGSMPAAERAAAPESLVALKLRQGAEARAEVEEQPQVYEHEAAGPTTVVGRETAEKPRSAQTTNKDRQLGDLEQKVLNKELTPAEADQQYGRQAGAGRPRAYPTFADWLKARIKHAEDEGVQRDILRRMEEQQTQPPGPKRNAAVRSLNAELDRTGKDYADQLRQALHELENPEQAEAERQARQQARLDRLKNLRKARASPQADRAVKLFTSDSANLPLRSAFERLHRENTSASIHDLLDRVITTPVIKGMLPQAAEYARRLKEMLPKDLQVMSFETAYNRYRDTSILDEAAWAAGAHFSQTESHPEIITLSSQPGYSHVEVLLHEGTHAVTARYIGELNNAALIGKDENQVRPFEEWPRDLQILSTMADEFERIYKQKYSGAVNQFKRAVGLSNAREERDLAYALSNFDEFHTMLMTSPVMQRLAAESVPSEQFRRDMLRYGYARQESRSVWSTFTGWVRRVLGLKKPDSNTLLDHVIRPMQDIMDRAVAFNRMSFDPDLRQYAEPLATAAVRAMPRFTRDDALRHLDLGRLGDTARRWLLSGATTDGIVNWNRRLFQAGKENFLEAYRTATEAWAAASTKFRDDYADHVSGLLTDFRKLGPERDKLAQLMNDATTAEVHLGTTTAGANAHLKTSEQLSNFRALQGRYSALSPAAKRVYQGLRDYYRKTYEQERTAQLGAMIKTALPDVTTAQVRAIAEAARTKRGINQLIDRPDASPVAAAFAEAWHDNRALVRGIAKVHSQGFVQGDYFPLRRFGDYVINYGSKGTDDYGVEMFERRWDAEQRRAELQRQGVEPSQVLDKRKSYLRTLVPGTVADELEAAARANPRLSERADEVRDLFASILLQHMSRSEAARSRMRRQGVQGASIDHERVLAQDFMSTASRIGYLERGPDRAAAMAAMRRHADYLGREGGPGEQIRAQAVLNELEMRQPSGDDASGAITGIARKFSAMGFVYSLMSPSHMATATIEAHMNSTALLGARHGVARAGLALAKALKDITPAMAGAGARNTLKSVGDGLKHADWNLANLARDRLIAAGADRLAMTDLFNRLNGAGLIDHSIVREMQRIARPSTDLTKGWWDRFLDLNTAAAHAVDVANKTAIAKAAYDLELRKSSDHDKAARYAVEMARTAMPNYNVSNKARITTAQGPLGGIAGPLTQFKQYGIHMYSVMANLVRASLNGATRQERVEARRAFAGILATHAMMAGTLTLFPDPLKWVLGAYDWIVGGLDKPHNYENDMRSWIAAAFGPELGEVISRGLPHAVGIDIHRRVGLANLLELPELKSFDAKGFAETVAAAMTGAAGEDATQMAGALNKFAHGDLMGVLKALTPRVVRDPIKAADLATRGVVDSKGKTILPAAKLSAGDIAAQAVGFQPSTVTEFREGRQAVIEAREEAQAERTAALNAFVTAGPSGRSAALAQVQAYNREHPQSPITYSQLLQAQKREAKPLQPDAFGLSLPKKGGAAFERAGAFANQ